LGISITGGAHGAAARFLGVRQCRSSKSPAAEPLASGERGRRGCCDVGESFGNSGGTTAGADGIAEAIGEWYEPNQTASSGGGDDDDLLGTESGRGEKNSFCTGVIYSGL